MAVLCNLLYGWGPDTPDKYWRALHPRKVLALNWAIIRQFEKLKYAGLYIKWKAFYKDASEKLLLKVSHCL